jgi:hypothetical protein
MVLLIEYFKSKNNQRDLEYKACINENLKCDFIDKVYVFISDNSNLDISDSKIEIVNIETRPTFKFLFTYCNEHLSGQKCIISNSDIIFDKTLEVLTNISLDKTFLALTRWDLFVNNNQWSIGFYDNIWRGDITTGQLSQDSWIFESPIMVDENSDFLMGKPGCDNRIVQVYHELGYNVKNPGKQIITKHLHLTNYRTYNHTDMVKGPYLLVTPTDDINIDSQKKTIPHF